jgi:tetratricopeptide (TPR) repeat protein
VSEQRSAADLVDDGCDLFDEGRFEEAAATFAAAVARGERWASLNLGNALAELRRWDEAATAFRDAIDAGELSARLNLANLYATQLFRYDEARAEYEQAWAEGDAAAAVGRGLLAAEEGDLDAALAWLTRAHDRGAPSAGWRLASVLGRLGRVDEAFALYDAAGEGDPEARLSRAILLRDLGRLDESREQLTESVADGTAEAVLYLADVESRLGHDDEAGRLFAEAAGADPEALLAWAAFLEQTGRDPLAPLAVYEQAITAGDRRAYYNLATYFAGLDRWSDARDAYERAKSFGDPKAAGSFEEWRVEMEEDEPGRPRS